MKKKYPFYQMLKNRIMQAVPNTSQTSNITPSKKIPKQSNEAPIRSAQKKKEENSDNEYEEEENQQPKKTLAELAAEDSDDDEDYVPPKRLVKQQNKENVRYDPLINRGEFQEWNEYVEEPTVYNPYQREWNNWKYDPDKDDKYDRKRAHASITDKVWSEIEDGRLDQTKPRRLMSKAQKDAMNQLIDITVNKKKTLKYDPKLLSLQYADKYAKNRGGWAQSIDVTPYDDRDEPEIVVFNKYGIPTHINGYSWGQSDAGIQQMYQEQYPGGFDPDGKRFVSFNRWKKQQFDVTKREKPWEPIRVKGANTELFDQLKGRGYSVPRAPAEALPVTTIWNKIVSKRMRQYIDEVIQNNDDIDDDTSDQYINHWVFTIIKDCVSLIQLSSLFFKYYMDSHFYELVIQSKRIPKDKEPETWKEYKKLINSEEGKVNRAQYRRMFYQCFVSPPDKFWWNSETSKRALETAKISSNKQTIKNEIQNYCAGEGAEAFLGYRNAERAIRTLKAGQSLEPEQRIELANQKQTKAYWRNIIKTHFSDAVKAWNETLEKSILSGLNGEWDQDSLKSFPRYGGSLGLLDKPIPKPRTKPEKWIIKLPDPNDTGKMIDFNMAEIPDKKKGKK